ncbi:MAG: protein kinase [Ignavibacteriae bacterium]|nr:hypothetical protein [Ignavibacteriota bacterium]NOG96755.1 protein kinase [Ignavibacteriota bacterium]
MINNRFKILKKIGEGRSAVFLCTDEFYDKKFAIKVLPANAEIEEIKAFEREYYYLSNFNSKNIIKVYEKLTILEANENEGTDWGIQLSSQFIVLEYFEGTPLLDFPSIKNEKVLREVIKQISTTLYYLHQSNYIYYDLKPENILINEVDDLIQVKLIDFGFTFFYPNIDELEVRGTAEYIAPEVLKKEFIDHRCDLYSFGILIYKIIYDNFPFSTNDELEIYKAHISKEFNFPNCKYSDDIQTLVKRLLAKDPSERFETSLGILEHLGIEHEDKYKNEWIGAKCFSGESSAIAAIDYYLLSEDVGNVLALRGTEGSGKSILLKQIKANAEYVINIKNYPSQNNFDYWKKLVLQILYSNSIYTNLADEEIAMTKELVETNPPNLIESLKAVLLKITQSGKFIVLIDDINTADDFSLLILKQFVQVLQVNNVKTIISENSEKEYFSAIINNCQIFNLTPFSKNEIDNFLETSYASFFPKNEVLELIVRYSDLLPGSIRSFIKDLIALNILEFKKAGPVITNDEEKLIQLEKYQETIFSVRINNLTGDELMIAELLSLFDSQINIDDLEDLLKLKSGMFNSLLKNLSEKNILSAENINSSPMFTSESLKNHIYSRITDVKKLHHKAAVMLKNETGDLYSYELGRQFELAGKIDESYQCYLTEIEKAKLISAYTYQRKLLEHVAKLPLNDEQQLKVNFELCNVLLTIDALNECLEYIDETSIIVTNEKDKENLDIIKGICLIKLSRLDEGILLLKNKLEKLKDGSKRNELKIEIASAEFDLGNYETAYKFIVDVINDKDSTQETVGRGYTLMGLYEIYNNNDLDNAIVEFNNAQHVFEKSNLISRHAGIQLNLGNIYSMIGETSKAEKHWEKAVALNLEVGNFEQEAYIQLNYGIYNYNKLAFEKAIELYNRALNIFNTTGNTRGQGLVLSNLGEVYTTICEYQSAINSLEKAESLFIKTRNIEEEVQVIFQTCKYYFILGLIDELKSKYDTLENLISRNGLTAKHQQYLDYQKQLILVLDETQNADLSELIRLKNIFQEQGEQNEFAFLNFQIAYQMLDENKFPEAIETIRRDDFEKLCNQNKLIFAEREFIFGLIASKDNNLELSPSIEHYEKAFNALENESITELTWKVTFKIAEYYFNRGNLHKAKEFIVYSKSLLEFISKKIKNTKIKNAYLSIKERKSAVEQLEKFENKY